MKKILVIVVALLVIIQFFTIDKTNPPIDMKKDFITITNPPSEIGAMIKSSCYDCHSNQTKYPWYSNVAPVSWLLKSHVNEGRGHINFSEWSGYNTKRQEHKIEACIDMVKSEEMPMQVYVMMHSEAKMSSEQRKNLVDWFTSLRDSL